MLIVLLMLVGFFASVVGAICGIGGGVVIKPVLDSIGFAEADTISFLSGLTVLCMSGYNIIRSFLAKEKMDLETGTPSPLAQPSGASGASSSSTSSRAIRPIRPLSAAYRHSAWLLRPSLP